MVFLGHHFVVTVGHGVGGTMSRVRGLLESDPDWLARGPVAVLHGLADEIVDGLVGMLDVFDDHLGAVEEQVFAGGKVSLAADLYGLKRNAQSLRRVVVPLVDVTSNLLDAPALRTRDELRDHFRDVHDHAEWAAERIIALDELVSSALGANLAQITSRQNEDMRRISAWAAIVAVPTLLASVYGMNFDHMPELRWRFGYAIVLVVMAVLSLVLYRVFRRSGWL